MWYCMIWKVDFVTAAMWSGTWKPPCNCSPGHCPCLTLSWCRWTPDNKTFQVMIEQRSGFLFISLVETREKFEQTNGLLTWKSRCPVSSSILFMMSYTCNSLLYNAFQTFPWITLDKSFILWHAMLYVVAKDIWWIVKWNEIQPRHLSGCAQLASLQPLKFFF